MKIEKDISIQITVADSRVLSFDETREISISAEEVIAVLLNSGDDPDPVRSVIAASNAIHQVFSKLPAESIAMINPSAREIIRNFFLTQADRFK
jgi:hypothetical protein